MIRFIIVMLPAIILLITIFLYSLHISTYYEDLSSSTIVIYTFAILFYIIGGLIPIFKSNNINSELDLEKLKIPLIIIKKYVHISTYLGLFLFLIEVIVLGFWNIPILSNDPAKNYQEFGLPIIHNYIVLLIFSGQIYLISFIVFKKKKYILLFIMIFIILIAGLSKGVILIYLIPIIIFLLFVSRKKWRTLFILIFFMSILFFLPNLIREAGKNTEALKNTWNYISGYESEYVIGQILYMYLTSIHYVFNEEVKDILIFGNFSNLINPILSLTFIKFFLGTIPSDFLLSGEYYFSAWNMAGGIAQLYQDFGLTSVIIYMFIYGFIISYLFKKRNLNFFSLLIFIEVYSISLLLFYSDFLKSPIFLFLIVQIYLFFLIYKIKLKRYKNIKTILKN